MDSDKLTEAIQLLRSSAAEYVPEAVELVDDLEAFDEEMRQWASDFDFEYVSEVVKYIPLEEAEKLYAEYTTKRRELRNRYANVMNKVSEFLAKLEEKVKQYGQTTEGS